MRQLLTLLPLAFALNVEARHPRDREIPGTDTVAHYREWYPVRYHLADTPTRPVIDPQSPFARK